MTVNVDLDLAQIDRLKEQLGGYEERIEDTTGEFPYTKNSPFLGVHNDSMQTMMFLSQTYDKIIMTLQEEIERLETTKYDNSADTQGYALRKELKKKAEELGLDPANPKGRAVLNNVQDVVEFLKDYARERGELIDTEQKMKMLLMQAARKKELSELPRILWDKAKTEVWRQYNAARIQNNTPKRDDEIDKYTTFVDSKSTSVDNSILGEEK